MINNLDIATKIRELRRASGLTQGEAARLSDVPLSSYRAYEQGKVAPPHERVQAILGALGGAVVERGEVTTGLTQTEEPGVFYLILRMNGQAFYRFRCEGEVLGDVHFDIDLDARVHPRDEDVR